MKLKESGETRITRSFIHNFYFSPNAQVKKVEMAGRVALVGVKCIPGLYGNT
jgi:hypothetical protein